MTVLNKASRYAHVDALRAVAVLLVVIAHAGLGSIVPGGSGVTIFFCISGFIISHLILREYDVSSSFNVRGFYFRRFRKIIPPLVLLILLPTIATWPLEHYDFGSVVAQLFFSYNWLYAFGHPHVLAGSDVVWSLAIEEQFYLLFAILWLILVRGRFAIGSLLVGSVATILVVNVWRLILAISGDAERRIYYGSDTRVDAIALGILVALILREKNAHSKAARARGFFQRDFALVGAILVYVGTLVIRDPVFRESGRYLLQAAAAGIFLLWGFGAGQSAVRGLVLRIAAHRLVATIGLASYSIYLVHLVLAIALRRILPHMAPLLEVLLLSVVGVGAGVLVYLLIERPLLRWKPRVFS